MTAPQGSDVVSCAVAALQRRARDSRLALVPGLAGDLLLIAAALDKLAGDVASADESAAVALGRVSVLSERVGVLDARLGCLEGMDGGEAGSVYEWARRAVAEGTGDAEKRA